MVFVVIILVNYLFFIRQLLNAIFKDKCQLTLDEFQCLRQALIGITTKREGFGKGESLETRSSTDKYFHKIRKQFTTFMSSVWWCLPFAREWDPITEYVTTDGINFDKIVEVLCVELHKFLFCTTPRSGLGPFHFDEQHKELSFTIPTVIGMY